MEHSDHPLKKYVPANATAEYYGATVAFSVAAGDIVSLAEELHTKKGLSLKLITATDERADRGVFKVWYVFGSADERAFIAPYISLEHTTEFPSVSSVIGYAGNFEKRVEAFFGLTAKGNPENRRTVLHENWPAKTFPLRKDFSFETRPQAAHEVYPFQTVFGEGIYEIPVGPIHAGIIEPGHFRFSVAGEEILLLEPRLGFVHKGSEKLFEKLPLAEKVRLAEKISGDSSFSHSLAFCQAVEELGGIIVEKRAAYLRTVFAELERLANHFGDCGATMLDTGFNFGGSQGARLREAVMQINERLTGSRFLRGVNTVGGVTKDISSSGGAALIHDLARIQKDFEEVLAIAENSVSLQSRLRETGVVPKDIAARREIIGVAGRAAGVRADARVDFPYAAYKDMPPFVIPTEKDGDVYARFTIRIKEVFISIKIIEHALMHLPEGKITLSRALSLRKNALAVSAVEGWRGEIICMVMTDERGGISRVVPRDPSVINWPVVGHTGAGNVVPDFPLINKSFNLSYSGNDL